MKEGASPVSRGDLRRAFGEMGDGGKVYTSQPLINPKNRNVNDCLSVFEAWRAGRMREDGNRKPSGPAWNGRRGL